MGRLDKAVILCAILGMLILLSVSIFVGPGSTARAGVQPQWDSIEGTANHVCYHHGGVYSIFDPNYDQGVDSGVVCRNGWAYDLNDVPGVQ